ncbi:MAG: cytochrome c3 family protein [Bacteroidota bacterium]|nr:cytochrome c3 family protein [Bacteroidota bacterium]
MKRLLLIALAILVVSSLVLAQTSLMLNAKHDLRVTATKTNAAFIAGASDRLCSYCHSPHIPAAGIKDPLWARTAKVDQNWGSYTGVQMDAVAVDPSVSTGDQHKNESNMCLSCHDGSAMYTLASYVKRPHISGSWTSPVNYETRAAHDVTDRERNRIVNGTDYTNLSHTHPVNFNYADAIATDGALKSPVNTQYAYLDVTTKVGRLFNGKVQCSSCHNPHLASTKMVQGTLTDGKLCVACHAK